MKRKLATAPVIAALPAIFIGVAGTPALADCPADTFCLYETAGYQDGEYRYKPTTSCTNLGSGINNDANSMRNYRNYNVRMWDLPGCGGSLTYTARAFSYDSDFGNNGFSNKASSLKRVRSANRRGDASDRVPDGADPGMLQQLSRESLATSQAEPQVADAMRAWRGCIREMGFTYQDPFAAMSDAEWWADEEAGAAAR